MQTDFTYIGKGIEPQVKEEIRDIPDFPRPGIMFKDITPIIAHPQLFHEVIDVWRARYTEHPIDAIVAVESRGFLFGAPLAYELQIPLYLARKQGKLPGETVAKTYALEYGSATIEMHAGVIRKGQRVVLIDDLLATGGTMAAVAELVEQQGGKVVECTFLVELRFLRGREALSKFPLSAIARYE